MQPEPIILLPPTHEQSLPCYHVAAELAEPFSAFLAEKGITAFQPPTELEKHGPDAKRLIEIEVEADTPVDMLESLIGEFFASEHAPVPKA